MSRVTISFGTFDAGGFGLFPEFQPTKRMSADTGPVDAVMRHMGGKGGRAEMEGLLARLEATKPCYSNWAGGRSEAFAHTLIDSLLPFSPLSTCGNRSPNPRFHHLVLLPFTCHLSPKAKYSDRSLPQGTLYIGYCTRMAVGITSSTCGCRTEKGENMATTSSSDGGD
ncbi:hypothetical protein AAMO2058_000423400 [Amorphochlora amoebiformis]